MQWPSSQNPGSQKSAHPRTRTPANSHTRNRVSVIIPTLNEEPNIVETIAAARRAHDCEIIVVDGGSMDRTVELVRDRVDHLTEGPRGRALQMNAGAAAATGDVLLFLHADTILPAGYDSAVSVPMADPAVVGGRFDLVLMPSSPLLWLTGELINLRSRLSKIATGDQAIFVRRSVFEEIGGYREMPLMEDVAFSRALKRRGRVACLRERVVTSSRRWRRDGVIRTIVLMWTLRALYFLGVSPSRLRRVYGDTR
jgi:rSAM/selenodomain-associated transferase 2